MNSFFKLIQPTIVKTSDDILLRKDLRGVYFVNFNIFGLDYFDDNYIISETDSGDAYYFLLEDYIDSTDSSSDNSDELPAHVCTDSEEDMPYHIDLENTNISSMIDLPRIYIVITDNFMQNYKNIFQNFVCAAFKDNKIYGTGIDGFKPGVDYYLNKTMYDYLYSNSIMDANHKAIMPNYLEETYVGTTRHIGLTRYWVDRTGDADENYTGLEYYLNLNNTKDYEFTEDELSLFYSTFCKTILKYTEITDDTKATTQNQLYNLVLNYWANLGSDETSTNLELVLNSIYTTTSKSSCGCNTAVSDLSYSTETCSSLYTSAMKEYLSSMLANTDFYIDWMSVVKIDSIGNSINTSNSVLCNLLTTLITEYEELTSNMVIVNSSINCDCPTVNYNTNICNTSILDNYKNVLEWVKETVTSENTNKIKIFGTQFGNLLPSLQI